MPQTFGTYLYYLHIAYRLTFWSKFSPHLRYSDNKFQIFPFNLYPLGVQNRILSSSSTQTYRQMYRYKQQHWKVLSQSYTFPYPQKVQIWLEMALIWGQTYSTFMYKGPSPLLGGIILCTNIQTSGQGPIHLNVIIKGQIKRYIFEQFEHMKDQKTHFYLFLSYSKFNVHW